MKLVKLPKSSIKMLIVTGKTNLNLFKKVIFVNITFIFDINKIPKPKTY